MAHCKLNPGSEIYGRPDFFELVLTWIIIRLIHELRRNARKLEKLEQLFIFVGDGLALLGISCRLSFKSYALEIYPENSKIYPEEYEIENLLNFTTRLLTAFNMSATLCYCRSQFFSFFG